MDALNTLRAVLVGGTFVLTLLLAFDGQWLPTAILSVGILAHLGLWAHLWRLKHQRPDERVLDGTVPPAP